MTALHLISVIVVPHESLYDTLGVISVADLEIFERGFSL